MSWTDEKVNKLKELWGKGNTASQIAEIIGGISRNAVIGKAHRLNLSAKIKTRSATSNESFENSIDTKIKLLVIIASLILLTSLLILYVSAKLKSERHDINLFNSSFSRALKSLFIPVLSGGIFCGFLILHKMYGLVAPATLIFYGLGLISASKYSYNELEILCYLDLLL